MAIWREHGARTATIWTSNVARGPGTWALLLLTISLRLSVEPAGNNRLVSLPKTWPASACFWHLSLKWPHEKVRMVSEQPWVIFVKTKDLRDERDGSNRSVSCLSASFRVCTRSSAEAGIGWLAGISGHDVRAQNMQFGSRSPHKY